MRRAYIAALCLALAACASAPDYAPASGPNASGYSETQIEDNRYFVTFRAKSGAEARLLEDFALLRAAEITTARGRDWFMVDRRSTDEGSAQPSGPRVGVSIGGGDYGRSSGVGVGVGVSFPIGGGGARASSATLEIRLGEGAKPDAANAYDASSVAASLRSMLAGGRAP